MLSANGATRSTRTIGGDRERSDETSKQIESAETLSLFNFLGEMQLSVTSGAARKKGFLQPQHTTSIPGRKPRIGIPD